MGARRGPERPRDRSGDAVQTFARHRVPLDYIAGPPEMVKDLHASLTKQSVNEGDIHAEEFSGY
jgi:hypothetical protein